MPYDLMDKEISKLKLETNPSYYDGYTKAIVAKQNDINSRLLCVDIFASGERVDISKYSTKMNVKMPNNKHLATNGQLIDGNLYFRIYDSMLTQIGHISCDVSLYKECINVVADTDGSINYTDVTVEQDTFINKVGDLGSYIFEYNDTAWVLEGAVITLSDYGITLNENVEIFNGDKIIISYSNYMLLTTETFFIVVQENISTEDADIPVDSNGKVFEYINADDVLIAIEQTHTHTNKDILDNTTAIYTTDDKIKLTNIDTSLYVEKSVMGKANGVATLDNSGLVPSAQLPSFVDDTIEGYTTSASAFSSGWLSLTDGGTALTPEKGKIYIVVSDGEYKNKQYRWGGTTYVLCNPSDVNSVNGKTGIVELILDDIPNGTNFVHTTNDFSNSYKTKLEGIEDGAQVNVNADWNATEGEPSFIKNKPLIPEGSKLYSGTGTNTDGAIHQKAVTDLLSIMDGAINSIKNDYLSLKNGGKMEGRISFADGNVALPETDNLTFVLGIESYGEGGGMIYTTANKLNVNSAKFLTGFDSASTAQSWGNQTGTFVMGMRSAKASASSIGEIAFRQDNPNQGQLSMIIDGTVYVNEGEDEVYTKKGGELTGAILFPGTATYSTTTQPTALSYGRLQAYGTLNINGNTDNSGTEYVNITAGHGCSSSTADGLSIGTDTLTWKNQDVIHAGNIPSYIQSNAAYGYVMKKTTIDASSLDVSTYYPVRLPLDATQNARIEVHVGLNSGTKPSWSTHANGFSTHKIWESNGSGWGTSTIKRRIFCSSWGFADIDPVRGITQLGNNSSEFVYVRGGGKYFFFTSHGITPTLYTSTYTGSGSQTISPTTSAPAEIVQNYGDITATSINLLV